MPATNELLQEGRYRVSQSLSSDGTVFEAYDTVRNTKVLVREFPVRLNKVATVSQRESMKLAFASQAKALSEIEHESLVHVEDYFSEIDRQFLVMETIQGDDLHELINRNKKAFAVDHVLRWADDLLDALDYIHSRKPSVIHRNIRPQNLRLHASGKVKLLGVGLDSGPEADFVESDSGDLRYSPMEQIWPGLDAASQKVITNSYDDRSERILKEPLDARSDIYSLGATLYFLITGREPVDPLERSIDLLEGKLDPLREPTKVDSQIPSEISDVLMKSLEIKRENRYDSATIMRQVLQAAVTRVKDREREDAHEQEEAAEIIRLAAQAKATPPVDQEAVKAEERRKEEQRRQQLLEEEQLRAVAAEKAKTEQEAAERAEAERLEAERLEAERLETQRVEAERAEAQRLEAVRVEAERAEAQRLEAEREKAEIAKFEAEEEARRAEESQPVDENLLEIPVSAEVMAYRDNSNDVDENELAAVLEEIEKAELEAEKAEKHESNLETSVEPNVTVEAVEESAVVKSTPVQVFDKPIDATPETIDVDAEELDLFSETENKGFSLPIPAIAGAIGLVVVIVAAVWFSMSGSPAPAPQPQPAPVEIAQPVQQEVNPPAETVAPSEQPVAETASTAEAALPAEESPASPKAAPTAKPKKADAKNDKKKAVTVDDLINDN